MFLSVEWAKRWLPAVFLLLSLFLPWWTFYWSRDYSGIWSDSRPWWRMSVSFLWGDDVRIDYTIGKKVLWVSYDVLLDRVPYLFFTSALIMVAGLCGLTDKSKTRTLGGLLGIAGVVSYFVFVFRKTPFYFDSHPVQLNPHFGIYQSRYSAVVDIWFLSVGFYLALAGSLMLLLPLIRTLVERLRKRL